jgi:hypothetical protein
MSLCGNLCCVYVSSNHPGRRLRAEGAVLQQTAGYGLDVFASAKVQ